MSKLFRLNLPGRYYFVSQVTKDRKHLFQDPRCIKIVKGNLNYYLNKYKVSEPENIKGLDLE